jgi:hypothetical protein
MERQRPPDEQRCRHRGTGVLDCRVCCAALRLDMTQWFRATAESYFTRIKRDGILSALREIKDAVEPAWDKAKSRTSPSSRSARRLHAAAFHKRCDWPQETIRFLDSEPDFI